ncbi:MAG TPA: hypothetical protein PK720_04330 [bacterium]|nr:hypothetical protein [bacterium]
MIEIILESKNETEAVFITKTSDHYHLPLNVVPVNLLVGQKLWLTISETEPTQVPTSPKEILNELLRSDEPVESNETI